MLEQLFINACILITIIFISSQVFKNTDLGPKSALTTRILLGLIGGISIALLIYFSISLPQNAILDFRQIIAILVATIGGWVPSLIAGLIGSIFRLFHHGLSTTSIIAALSILTVSIFCGLFSRVNWPRKTRLLTMTIVVLILKSITYYLQDYQDLPLTLAILWSSTFIIGAAAWYLVNYLDQANQAMKRLRQEATHDHLTGLENSRHFDLVYHDIVEDPASKHRKIAMLLIDIDLFKNINDTYGHAAGDLVIQEFGTVLKKAFRDVDIVSRIGGEEFAVILLDMPVEQVKLVAERFRSLMELHAFVLPNGESVRITASVGIAAFPETVSQIEYLKETSDRKMYEAKLTGRNRVCA